MKTLPSMSTPPIDEDKQAKLNDFMVINLGLQNGAKHWVKHFLLAVMPFNSKKVIEHLFYR